MGANPSSTPRKMSSVSEAIPMPSPTPRRRVQHVSSIKVVDELIKCMGDDTLDLQDARDIGNYISKGTVSEVFLLNCDLSDTILLELISVLGTHSCPKLLTIQLSGCSRLTDVSAVPLIKWVIKYASNIRVLSLSRTAVGNPTLTTLARCISKYSTSLRRVWLCGLDNITDAGLTTLVTSVRFSPGIELNCSGCINVSSSSLDYLVSSEYVNERKSLQLLKALTYRKWQTWALSAAGYRHLENDRLKEASACFMEATQVSPESSHAAFGMAAMCYMSGKGRQASTWNSRAASLAVKRIQKKYDKYEPSNNDNNNNNNNNTNYEHCGNLFAGVVSRRHRNRRIRWVSDLPHTDPASVIITMAAAILSLVPTIVPTPSFKVISTFAVRAAQAALSGGRYENHDTADDSQ
eukprot:TRINITY_DN22753_c0_g1_i1.p1 TRINITY_DN22753_c0_g1~~TRINITY_DN22753_c0_g1_i1.p1  ORF type:complete len:407 (+),score=74.86 TRINITY_DN22753_c0_g1_i1:98-1318(+)